MATSQRVSRGFHRLGIFLAALPLIAGIAVTLFFAKSAGDSVPVDQKLSVCEFIHCQGCGEPGTDPNHR